MLKGFLKFTGRHSVLNAVRIEHTRHRGIPMTEPIEQKVSVDFGNWQAYSILIVDDEAGMRSFLERALKPLRARRECRQRGGCDRSDVQPALRPDRSGYLAAREEWHRMVARTAFQRLWRGCCPITAFADIETAINALRGGASDFILKPFRVDQILNSIKRCFERARLARENYVLRRELAELGAEVDGLVGHSALIQQLRTLIKRIARCRRPSCFRGIRNRQVR